MYLKALFTSFAHYLPTKNKILLNHKGYVQFLKLHHLNCVEFEILFANKNSFIDLDSFFDILVRISVL